jgi:hypothetical protein
MPDSVQSGDSIRRIFWDHTGNPNLTPLLPTHIVRRGPKSDLAIDEFRMGLRSTYMGENRFEPRAFTIDLAWNGEDQDEA